MSLVPPAVRHPRAVTPDEPSTVDAWLHVWLRLVYAIAALFERPKVRR